MDTKRLIIGMVVIFALFLGWQGFLGYLAKKNNWTLGPTTKPSATQPVAQTSGGDEAQETEHTQVAATHPSATVSGQPSIAQAATRPSGLRAVTPPSPTSRPAVAQTTTLGNSAFDPKGKLKYPMALTLSSQGAGVESVALNRYREHIGDNEPFVFQRPELVDPSNTRSLATRSVTIDGKTLDLTGATWALVSSDESSATYALDIVSADGKLLTIRKRYELFPSDSVGKGYELRADYTFVDAARPMKVSLGFNGPTPPQQEVLSHDDRQIIAGYWDEGIVKINHEMVYDFSKKMESKDFLKNKDGLHVLWAGASSVYFDAIVRPIPLGGAHVPNYLKSVETRALNPDSEAVDRQVVMTFATEPMEVKPGESAEIPLAVFFGPKPRALLNSDYYSKPPISYNLTLTTMSSWCAFGWLVDLLVMLLQGFHFIFRDWGMAIIGLVVLVRLILHPITKKSTISMQSMGKMGPEMERLRKKYGDNKEELNKAMMQFYKTQGVTPILGCLPMFLQMPIWIALWSMLQNTFELRQAPFFYGLTWIHDLSQPDHLITFSHPVHILFFTIDGLNLLPIILGVVYFLQQKYTPRPPAATPEQEKQQKMMQYMSLLFPLFLYTGPSGLNLYIATSSGIGILEQKRIRDHINRQQEAEKAGKVVVEVKPTRASKRGHDDDSGNGHGGKGGGKPKKPSGGLGGWLADLQAKAEEMRRASDRKK